MWVSSIHGASVRTRAAKQDMQIDSCSRPSGVSNSFALYASCQHPVSLHCGVFFFTPKSGRRSPTSSKRRVRLAPTIDLDFSPISRTPVWPAVQKTMQKKVRLLLFHTLAHRVVIHRIVLRSHRSAACTIVQTRKAARVHGQPKYTYTSTKK